MESPRSSRNTHQRRAIRDVLHAAGRPLSPQEVLDLAQDQVPGLGIATVYRALKALVDEAYLRTVEVPGQPPRYELAALEHHHHFHCRSCGRVFDIEGCPGKLKDLAPPGFELQDHEVVLYGRCAECARK